MLVKLELESDGQQVRKCAKSVVVPLVLIYVGGEAILARVAEVELIERQADAGSCSELEYSGGILLLATQVVRALFIDNLLVLEVVVVLHLVAPVANEVQLKVQAEKWGDGQSVCKVELVASNDGQ